MALHSTMCFRLEDGNPPTWGRCIRGEESQSDSQVSAEHVGFYWSATLWHAGTVEITAVPLLYIKVHMYWLHGEL